MSQISSQDQDGFGTIQAVDDHDDPDPEETTPETQTNR